MAARNVRFDYTVYLPQPVERTSRALLAAVQRIMQRQCLAHAGEPLISERAFAERVGISRSMAHGIYEKLLACGAMRRQSDGDIYYLAATSNSNSPAAVGVVLPCELSKFISGFQESRELRMQLYSGIVDRATSEGWGTVIVLPPPIGTPPEQVAEFIAQKLAPLNGLIHFGDRGVQPDSVLEQIWEYNALPQVFFACTPKNQHCGLVHYDAEGGIVGIARLLHTFGHRQLAIIQEKCGPRNNLHYQLEDIHVAQQWFQDNAIAVADANCYSIDIDLIQDEIGHAIDDVRQNYPRVRAFWCRNETLANATLGQLRERKLRVPEDYSVIGFNDLWAVKDAKPFLTSVRLPFYECGKAAVKMVLDMKNKPDRTGRSLVALPVLLNVRQSLGKNLFSYEDLRDPFSVL